MSKSSLFRRGTPLSVLIFFFAFHCAAGAAPEPVYASIAPGLDYAHVRETNHPWSIHIARLDRSRPEYALRCTLAQNKVQGLETVAGQVRALPPALGTPMAAVNGDFFVIAKGPYQGDPRGLQILDGELLSAPAGACFWADAKGRLSLGMVASRFTATLPRGGRYHFELNQERGSSTNSLVLFTPTFGDSTRTTNGWELVLEKVPGKSWLPLQADKTYAARVREIRRAGDTPLHPETAVLSIAPTLTNQFARVQPGDALTLATETSRDVSQAVTALGGRPLLVVNGREQHWSTVGTNAPGVPRHPRTAMGWNTKYFYLVVVDGRQQELSMGMTFPELAHYLKELGCTEAMNLDGGGSTTFWLQGKIMNSPSDKHERTVANALVIERRN